MLSCLSLGQPTLKAGCMQKVPTDNVQGVVRYGRSRGRLTSGRPMSSFTAWCPMLSCLSRPADGDGVSPGKAGYMDWLMRLVPTNKVSPDLKYSTLMTRTLSWGSRCAKAMCSHPGVFVRAQCREWWRRLQCRLCPVDALDSHEQRVACSTLK